ncbi:MAG: flavodoxin domain-containing protein [Candidatus Bathyarchaeota archaeon]|jgi:NAD(P)H dehydrogenase (quinone)|nr:flavodoxin domain-containing protein [Candidatus Bathyarchaeota archaeon]
MKVLIVYDSSTGNTEKMAYAVEDGVKKAGVESVLKHVDEVSVDEIPQYQGLILGSPVYYGLPSWKIKKFIDESVKYHGKFDGMVGGSFASAGGTHTGAETAIIAMNEMLLVHGMVIQGSSTGSHYGAASVGSPNDSALEACRKLGERVGKLVKNLKK